MNADANSNQSVGRRWKLTLHLFNHASQGRQNRSSAFVIFDLPEHTIFSHQVCSEQGNVFRRKVNGNTVSTTFVQSQKNRLPAAFSVIASDFQKEFFFQQDLHNGGDSGFCKSQFLRNGGTGNRSEFHNRAQNELCIHIAY